MTTLIIKSKIWNKSNIPLINYKEKNYIKQKITVEKTGIISRNKDKIIYKQTENLNTSNNSSDNTNYMNEPRNSELITIEKRPNDTTFYVNCGEWSKDLMQLIDQNAVYFLYKGLTIENFLKEKQKYYVLNQGDIIKLGKIYLKILHIKLTGGNKKEEEDKKDKANATTDKNQNENNRNLVSSESESNSDDESGSSSEDEEKESYNKNEVIKEEDEEEEGDEGDKNSEVIKKKQCKIIINENNKKDNGSNLMEYKEPMSCPHKNINKKKKNYKIRLNRSFNDNLSDINLEQIKKENIKLKRSISWNLKKNNLSSSINSVHKVNSLTQNTKNKINKNKDNKNKKKLSKVSKKNNEKLNSKMKGNESIKSQQNNQKGKICRICLCGEDSPVKNPLICPCICKGSMKYIHYNCLKNWLNSKIESDLGYGRDIEIEQPTITYSTKDISCELCKTKLPDYIKHKGKIYNVSFYKPKYSKFLVLESIRDDNRRTKFIHIIPLNRRQIIKIGRLNSCDLSLPDFSISRVHCCMYIESGQLFLENNSKFATKILVQNPKLTMSLQYPLCIEVQKTYLKLKLEKPFSLFSCCNVYTTSMSKMLVYQKQNERCFDLFCSMVFKEDDAEQVDEIEGENNNNINNNNEDEDVKSNESIKNNKDNKNLNNNKDKKKNEEKKNKEITRKLINKNENKIENNNITVNKTKEEIKKRPKLEEGQNKNKKGTSIDLIDDKEKITENNEDQKDMNNKELIDDDNKGYTEDKKSIKKECLIDDEQEKSINFQNESEKINESKNYENKNIIHLNIDKQNTNINRESTKTKLIDTEPRTKTKEKEDEHQDLKNLIDSDFKLNGRRSMQNNSEKNNINLFNTEFKNFGKKLIKKNEDTEDKEKPKKEEKIKKEENKEKKTDNDKIIKKKYNIINKETKKEEIKIKKELNKQNTLNKKNDNSVNKNKNEEIIGPKKDNENKVINNDKKKESKKIEIEKDIKNKKDNIKIEIDNDEKIYEIISKEKNKIKSENNNNIKIEDNNNLKRKNPKKNIDLNAINDLSYKKCQNITNNNNLALDNYQSIFGLMPSRQNESALLLAPRHTKNKNLKNFDLNFNNDNINCNNNSSDIWNKYSCQYEEDRRNKDI